MTTETRGPEDPETERLDADLWGKFKTVFFNQQSTLSTMRSRVTKNGKSIAKSKKFKSNGTSGLVQGWRVGNNMKLICK
jgi:hypothetical protein